MDGVGAISFGQQIGFRWRRPITCLSLTLLLLIELCARLASARFFVRRSLDGLTSRSSPVGPFAEQVNMIEARRSHRCSGFMVGLWPSWNGLAVAYVRRWARRSWHGGS